MKTKTLFTTLSACLFSLMACEPKEQINNTDENCLIEEELPTRAAASVKKAEPASTPASAPASVPVVEPALPKDNITRSDSEFRFVFFEGERPYIALQKVPYDIFSKGKARWLSKQDPFLMQREVDLTLLPRASAAWIGQAVKLYREDGSFCEAKVEKLSVFGRMYGEEYYKSNPAAEVWTLMQQIGALRLVAELDIDECKGARFARLASLPAPEMAKLEAVEKKMRNTALTTMQALPLYKTLQKEYNQYQSELNRPNPGRWYYDEGSGPEVKMAHISGKTLIFAFAGSEPTCGSFWGSMTVIWELQNTPEGEKLELLYQGQGRVFADITIDVDADGTFELLSRDTLHRTLHGVHPEDIFYTPEAYEDCGC